MDSEARELELVQRAGRGDTVATAMLLKQSRERLCRYIARKIPADLRGVVDADDLVQETHVEAFRHIDRFEPRERDAFFRWVATIALRKLRDAIKWRRRAKRGGGRMQAAGEVRRNVEESMVALLDGFAGPGRSPSSVVGRDEAVKAVKLAMSALPARYHQAVWGVHIEGRAVKEVAEEMGCTDRAVHGLCRRGIALLRENLGSVSRYLSPPR